MLKTSPDVFLRQDQDVPNQKCFIVLGMHRSATSLIAKGLVQAGVDMGAKYDPRPDNPQGHWENWEFVQLNDRILAAAGGAWDNPPPQSAILNQSNLFEKDIKNIINKFSYGRQLWGWKDPRTTLTVRLYLPYIKNPHFICCFRDKDEVVDSLIRRNGGQKEKWEKVCNEYNRRLIQFLTERV